MGYHTSRAGPITLVWLRVTPSHWCECATCYTRFSLPYRLLVCLCNGYVVSVNALLLLHQRRNAAVTQVSGCEGESLGEAARLPLTYTPPTHAARQQCASGCHLAAHHKSLLVLPERCRPGRQPRGGVGRRLRQGAAGTRPCDGVHADCRVS